MDSIEERRWYIVQTYAGYENRVKANLEQRIATMGMEDRIFSVLVPVEERVSVKDGKSKKVTRKLFPSYVLVEMRLNDQSWYVVRHTPGVTGFVGSGNHP
ncbi:MAG TPA: transcription termination/antitermination NusG family protein, partial [Aminivibrio sp.]|nr:transcription termination/antitermination NusG family protein [Aminivibrio sp.]